MGQVNWTRQLGLALTLFALGTAAYWLEYKHKPDQESKEEQVKKAFQLKDTPVQSIRISDSGRSFLFTCSDLEAKLCRPTDNSKWEVSEPSKLKADDANVNGLISTLANLNTSETIDLKSDTEEKRQALLKEYGLDRETRKRVQRVQVNTASGNTTLYLGFMDAIGNQQFALIEKAAAGQTSAQNSGDKADETKVYLVPSYFKSNFDHDLAYWRNKKLFTLASHEVNAFDLKNAKTEVSGKRDNGQWVLTSQKEEMPGDLENIDGLLSAATYLTAKSFVSDDKLDAKAKAALKGFSKIFEMTLKKDEKEKAGAIQVVLYEKMEAAKPAPKNANSMPPAKPSTKLYATVSNLDPLFELDPTSKDRLNKTVKDLRFSKLITSMDRFGAKKVEFSGESLKEPLVLENSDGKWTRSPKKEEIADEKLQDLLEKLSGNRIREFYSGSSIPAGEKTGIQFTLVDEKNEVKRHLVFWKQADRLYARDLLSKKPEAYLVDTLLREVLPWDQAFFAKAKPESKPAGEPNSAKDNAAKKDEKADQHI